MKTKTETPFIHKNATTHINPVETAYVFTQNLGAGKVPPNERAVRIAALRARPKIQQPYWC